MAQKMIDLKREKQRILNTVSTQTGELFEFCLCLSKTKRARLYYSDAYNEYVLSFSFGNCKKFIISKSMWKILREKITHIDYVLNYGN